MIIRIRQISASLPPSDSRGPKLSLVAMVGFCGLSLHTKLHPQNLNVKHYEEL